MKVPAAFTFKLKISKEDIKKDLICILSIHVMIS